MANVEAGRATTLTMDQVEAMLAAATGQAAVAAFAV
jgi:hypothetical protein